MKENTSNGNSHFSKSKPNRIILIVSTLLFVIFVSVFFTSAVIKDSTPTSTSQSTSAGDTTLDTQPHEDGTKAPLSVEDIPNAEPFANDGTFESGVNGKSYTGTIMDEEDRKNWANTIKAETPAILGLVTDSSSVLVRDGNAYYRITTMVIEVQEIFCNLEETKELTAVYACRYKKDPSFYNTEEIHYRASTSYHAVDGFGCTVDMAEMAMICADAFSQGVGTGLFLLEKADDYEITVENQTVDLSQYGEYRLTACLACDPILDIALINRTGLRLYTDMLRDTTTD